MAYANPVLVTKPVSSLVTDPGVVRLRSIGADRLDLHYHEKGCLDGKHTAEDILYMLAEAGQHTLGGLEVDAALIETIKLALNGEWESVTFTNGFSMCRRYWRADRKVSARVATGRLQTFNSRERTEIHSPLSTLHPR